MTDYGETLGFFLTEHPKDATLVLECDDAEDFGVRLIAKAYGRPPEQVLFDLREKADELWQAES